MEKLSMWCKLVTSVSVVTAAVSLLVPESSIKKAFNTLMSTILVFALIYPLNGKSLDALSFDIFNEKSNSFYDDETIEDYVGVPAVEVAQAQIKEYIEKITEGCEAEVICDYEEDKVRIVKINLRGNFDGEAEAVYYTEIKEICGEDTVIEFNGERYE
ncbi:MAG: stage III sporulation protein AF [Clostridia bacterium]|nr:stage III sporulation protein AF [Clostridia bacterium]